MSRKIVAAAGAAVLALLLGAAATADEPAGVAFPDGFRRWVLVKSFLNGPDTKTFERDGGFRHFYANDKAMDGYRTGRFPDGSVIVDERVGGEATEGTFHETQRLNINVMVKDSARFAATDGWGFETFKNDVRVSALTPQIKANCHACHTRARAHDLVFSRLRD